MRAFGRTPWLALGVLLAAAAPALAQKPERIISDISAGFGFGTGASTTLKLGHWAPIAVQIGVRHGAFRGEIELTTVDSDGQEVTVVIPNVAVPESVNTASATFYGQVKFGKSDLGVKATLVEVDENGRRTVVDERNERLGEQGRMAEDVRSGQELLVYYGEVGGVFDLKELAKNAWAQRAPAVARFRSERDFPTQWYGYGGVDYLILGTGDERFFDRLDPQRASAIRTWVRQGGRLVVSVGKNWQIVRDSFLAPMLPATIAGVDELDLSKLPVHSTFEHFADRKAPMELRNASKMPSPKLENLKTPGRTVLQHAGRPLAYTAAYGLGQVTLLAFDVGEPPFRDWKGAAKFWANLLKLRIPTENELNQQQNYYGRDYDESAEINNRMEDFPDVTVVPFHWVALLIFLYILLIGPVDYFFLKKVVKRLELTWITFPTWVVLVSAAAYYSAYLLKGDDLRLNRLEVVDVDQASKTLRGTGFLCIFSPRIDRYSVAYTPELASGGSWSELAASPTDLKAGSMGEDQTVGVTSWHGVPVDEGMRGFGGDSAPGILGKRPYRFQSVDSGALLRVQEAPVQVWSVKTFTSQWLGRGEPVVEAALRVEGLQLRGTIKNLLPHPLENVALAFGELVWTIPRLEPDLVVDVAAVQSRSLGDMLRQGSGGQVNYQPWQRQRQMTGTFSDTDNLVRSLLFHRARGDMTGGARREAGSFYLSNLDLSQQLEFGRAVLLARLPMNTAPGGKLWLNEAPNDKTEPTDPGAKQRTQTYLRVLLDPAKENS
jgi:hypothetical protein